MISEKTVNSTLCRLKMLVNFKLNCIIIYMYLAEVTRTNGINWVNRDCTVDLFNLKLKVNSASSKLCIIFLYPCEGARIFVPLIKQDVKTCR